MKKSLAILLVVVLFMSLSSFVSFAADVDGSLYVGWDPSPISLLPEGSSVGVRFVTTGSWKSCTVYCPSYDDSIGNLTFSVFKWEKNFETTVSKTAVAEKVFENFTDNTWVEFTFSSDIEAGEYLLLVHEGSDPGAGVGVWMGPVVEGILVYKDGIADPSIGIMATIKVSTDDSVAFKADEIVDVVEEPDESEPEESEAEDSKVETTSETKNPSTSDSSLALVMIVIVSGAAFTVVKRRQIK
ncbi:MAG: hypothetical protein PHV95_05265 [Eubacteriales bacterium]|nr:hypothetical protein [Eubacteriales bacterium]